MEIIPVDNNDEETLKRLFLGKNIYLYGGGSFSKEIQDRLMSFGLGVTSRVVDREYISSITTSVREVGYVTTESFISRYTVEDVIIWAMGSASRMHDIIEMELFPMPVYIIWNVGFWTSKYYYSDHLHEFEKSCELLADKKSKEVFKAYCKATEGHIDEDLKLCEGDTYFNDLTMNIKDGFFVDCGAFNGDTGIEFQEKYGKERKVIAFEPDIANYSVLSQRVQDKTNWILINKACYSYDGVVNFNSSGESSSISNAGVDSDVIDCVTIDSIIGEEVVAFIKMDVEGSELEALKGAINSIKRDMPVLAISAYHRMDDLIRLIPFINTLSGNNIRYNIYLKHHSPVSPELVIYAIPDRLKNGV